MGAAFLALLCTSLAARAAESSAQILNPVVQWNRLLLTMVRTAGAQPATIHPTRSFAIMHAAIYDAVNAIDGAYKPYLVAFTPGSQFGSEDAAAIAAAHEVLLHLYPSSQAMLDLQLQQQLAQIPDGAGKTQGMSIGQTVADRILTLRTNDGSNVKPTNYVFGTAPGDFQSPAPVFPPQPQFTHWAGVTPFTLASASQFRPGGPPALTSSAYADAFNEIKTLGVTNSTTATTDQVLVGRFWNGAIQNYWNEIAQTAALDRSLTTAQSARLFALLNLTFADSVVAFYDAKYTYNFWRPVTAIRAADTDNNPNTVADPEWIPEVGKTAPDPSYPGAHAVISAAGGRILNLFFETDQAVFNVTSEVLPGVQRSFTSFSAAAEEATISRIDAGQHFRFDLVAGQQLGHAIADLVAENFLSIQRPAVGYLQHNLVSDLAGMADATDPNLVNPWGITFSGESPFWVADNHSGLSSIYDGNGSVIGFSVHIPTGSDGNAAAPTGAVSTSGTNFIAIENESAKFIFASENGTLSAWGTGTNAVLKVDNSSSNSIYKGLAIASVDRVGYLYATDFHNGQVDVFDGNFTRLRWAGAFVDSGLPAGFAPFGIATVGTNLLVSYAMQDSMMQDDIAGVGNGYIDAYDLNGHLLRRFASNGPLNSPWGMVVAPSTFGEFGGAILIGNFGDGRINAFDPATGAFLGSLKDANGAPITILGLWGLSFGNGANAGATDSLYFTAGIPGGGAVEDHGLFGRISAVTSLQLSITALGGDQLELSWSGNPGSYLIQKKTSLSAPNWTDFTTTTNLSTTVTASGPTGFFRVVKQ